MKAYVQRLLGLLFLVPLFYFSQQNYVAENFTKIDTLIPMRDGVKLYTVIYIPKDHSQKYPFLMNRTPYSVAPYGKGKFKNKLGPNDELMKDGYIFVYQDVRGRYMSGGHFQEMTPYIPDKKSNKDIDESSDTYDTVAWLLKNVSSNNGRVGLYGISYPGFYATASLPDAHPAIKAVSPQAPVTDEFIGDDANHNGAFFLMDNFYFMNYFGKQRNGPVEDYGGNLFPLKVENAYDFFLKLGPLKNTQTAENFNHQSHIWNEYLMNDTYDQYWRSRNIRQYLKNITIPTLVVGGWFDAEDLFGAIHTFKAIDEHGGKNDYFVMGPWTHGAWASRNWSKFGSYDFGENTAQYYKDHFETRFFNYYLKDQGTIDFKKINVYNTGANRWESFDSWPLKGEQEFNFYFSKKNGLSEKPATGSGFNSYKSDPANPVPYTAKRGANRNNEYMIEDQSFTLNRKDVVAYTSPVLKNDLTVAGSVTADLYVSTSGTDADFIVKVIDAIPLPSDDVHLTSDEKAGKTFYRLVRAEVMRGKFRNDYQHPQPFEPGKPTLVRIHLNDIMHTFKKGHRIQIQVQSSWFPLVDRNPQKFMTIPEADEKDFQSAEIRIYYGKKYPSKVVLPVTAK